MEGQETNPLRILAVRLMDANVVDPGEFTFATQLNVKELETFKRARSGTYAQQWAHVLQEELDQLEKNRT